MSVLGRSERSLLPTDSLIPAFPHAGCTLRRERGEDNHSGQCKAQSLFIPGSPLSLIPQLAFLISLLVCVHSARARTPRAGAAAPGTAQPQQKLHRKMFHWGSRKPPAARQTNPQPSSTNHLHRKKLGSRTDGRWSCSQPETSLAAPAVTLEASVRVETSKPTRETVDEDLTLEVRNTYESGRLETLIWNDGL